MRFFFPDSQDQIDPSFDFDTEHRSPYRVRQKDDLYAHEVLSKPAFSGILLSKAIVDGSTASSGRYSLAQRHQLYRIGVRDFFRLDNASGPRLETMGDCGAFAYVKEEKPIYTVDEVIDFYDECQFDLGVAVDHIIPAFYRDPVLPGLEPAEIETWRKRQKITLELADEFLKRHAARRCRFTPMGVAQGWSSDSYRHAIQQLQKMGYKRIAVGGLVPLRTNDILISLRAIDEVRRKDVQLHLLGVTRIHELQNFADMGVTSFDSTSPFRQAFKDAKNNYYTPEGAYLAIRVPQVDGNPKVMRLIKSGAIDQGQAMKLEANARHQLKRYEADPNALDAALNSVLEYEKLTSPEKNLETQYRRSLADRPWEECPCDICEESGIQVMLLRGSERNKRRGFHNLYVFNNRLQAQIQRTTAS